MRRVFRLLLPLVALTGATPAAARPLDLHIQRVLYNPDQVVSLRGALGWQIMIEFAADERIENVSIGDSPCVAGDAEQACKDAFPESHCLRHGGTNMEVVTSQRRYAFALSTGPSAYPTHRGQSVSSFRGRW